MDSVAIKVKFFGSLGNKAKERECSFKTETPLTAIALWQAILPGEALPANLLVARNFEYIKTDVLINDGDEVAFMPAVTGG